MKIKQKYIGGKVYSESLGRLILICDENIEILKRDKLDHLYVTTKAKRTKQLQTVLDIIMLTMFALIQRKIFF